MQRLVFSFRHLLSDFDVSNISHCVKIYKYSWMNKKATLLAQKKEATRLGGFCCIVTTNYLLENWGARRAAFKPYFFLSFILGSRVRKPAAFREARYSGFSRTRAREMP